MKKYIAVAFVVFVLVLTGRLFFKDNSQAKNIPAQAKFSQVIGEKLSPQTLPRVQKYVEVIHSQHAEPQICREARERRLTQRIDEIIRDIADRRTTIDLQCAVYDEDVTSKELAEAIYKNCQRDDLIAGRKKEECWQALVFFKAALVAHAFGEKDVNGADAETLVYLFMYKMSQGELRTPSEIAALKEITDRLIELMPDSPSVMKAAALPRVIGDFENFSKGTELDPTVDAYIDEALRLNPSDLELQEISLLRKLYEPSEKLSVQKAEMLVQSQPQSSLAQYFFAGALEHAGRHKEAISAARRAHELEPENNRYRRTLEKLQRGERGAFTVQLGVNFDNL